MHTNNSRAPNCLVVKPAVVCSAKFHFSFTTAACSNVILPSFATCGLPND